MKHAIYLILLFSFGLYAQVPEVVGVVVCPGDKNGQSMGYCHYTLKNLTRAQTLVKKVEQTIFQGIPLTPPEGILEPLGENDKVLTFWHSDPEVLEKIKQVLPMLDTLESFSTNSIIEMKTEIFEVSETGLSNLGAEISNLKFGSDIADTANSGSYSNGGIDLKIGSLQLSGLISAEKSKGTLERKASIVRAIPNFSSIEYSDNAPVYFAPGAGTNVHTQYEGLSMQGTVSINYENNKLVNIKDFVLNYGVITEEGNVNTVHLPYEDLILEEGVAFPLISSKTVGTMKTVKGGILGFGRKTEVENTKLLVYTSVKIYQWEEYVSQIRSLLDVGKQKFEPAEIENMETSCPHHFDVLSDLDLIAKRDALGDPMLSVRLRKNNACQSNIKTRVRVKISGEGINKNQNEHVLTFERFMHIPLRIQGIPLAKFNDPDLDFKIVLETLGRTRSKVKLNLRFAPGPYNIEDMFWIR